MAEIDMKDIKPPEAEPPAQTRHLKKKVSATKSVTKKTSWFDSFSKTFFGDDAGSVMRYIGNEILIPALKNTINEMVSGGIERLLFGDGRPRSSVRTRSSLDSRGRSYISYNDYYSREAPRKIHQRTARYDFTEYVLATRRDAIDIHDNLRDLADRDAIVSVGDFFEQIDMEPEHVDFKWGWDRDDLENTEIRQVRDGFVILFPEPSPIED